MDKRKRLETAEIAENQPKKPRKGPRPAIVGNSTGSTKPIDINSELASEVTALTQAHIILHQMSHPAGSPQYKESNERLRAIVNKLRICLNSIRSRGSPSFAATEAVLDLVERFRAEFRKLPVVASSIHEDELGNLIHDLRELIHSDKRDTALGRRYFEFAAILEDCYQLHFGPLSARAPLISASHSRSSPSPIPTPETSRHTHSRDNDETSHNGRTSIEIGKEALSNSAPAEKTNVPAGPPQKDPYKFNPEKHEYRDARCNRCESTKSPRDCFWPKLGGRCIRCKKDRQVCRPIVKAKSKPVSIVFETEDEEEDADVREDRPTTHVRNAANMLPTPKLSATKRIPIVPTTPTGKDLYTFNPEIHEHRRPPCARCRDMKTPGAGGCFRLKTGGNKCMRCLKQKQACRPSGHVDNADNDSDDEDDATDVPEDLHVPHAPNASNLPLTSKHDSIDSRKVSQVRHNQSKLAPRSRARMIDMISDDEEVELSTSQNRRSHKSTASSFHHSAAQKSSKPPPSSPPVKSSKTSSLPAASSSLSELSMFLEVNTSVESLSRSFAEEISALQALQKARKRNQTEIERLLLIGRGYLARGASKGAVPDEIFTRFEATVADLLKMMSDGLVGGSEVIELQQVVARLREMLRGSSASGTSSLPN